jgi:hypothetical protein
VDVLLPKLEAEPEHAGLSNVFRRKKGVEYRVLRGNILEVQILDASSRIVFDLRRFMHKWPIFADVVLSNVWLGAV